MGYGFLLPQTATPSHGSSMCRTPTGTVLPWSSNTLHEQEGGLDNLKGKKIGYIFLDAGYGREPIPLLEQLAAEMGFELMQYPVGQGNAEPVLAVAERAP
jgi:hypothetical protein